MSDARTQVEAIVQQQNEWLHFSEPMRIVVAERPGDVSSTLREVERLTRDSGWYAVGWVSYEAAAAFGLRTRPEPQRWPMAWFALFHPHSVRRDGALPPSGAYQLGAVTPSSGRASFRGRFERVKEHIAAGDTYQANFTFQTSAKFSGDARRLFADLVEAQQGRYSLYLSVGDLAVCSASPELFFELDGAEVRTRPMKGTAKRGLTPADDEARRLQLANSVKEQAENVMIVDMMRNDLGRIADVGSVTVRSLFDTERYPTIWQMTSEVTARSLAPLEQIFAALHPSASVTGAPKVRTMELLAELEEQPRGIYTGAMGFVAPDGNARFNVAIRTAVVDHPAGVVHFGVGSGIVWDSDADAEYDECLLKSAVLGRQPVAFELLETLRWSPTDGFFLLDRHLERLSASARYFGFTCAVDEAIVKLRQAIEQEIEPRRVRLLVSRDGGIAVEHRELPPANPLRVSLAARPVSSDTVWLYHKTTHQKIYEEARHAAAGVDDVLLWNERGELTESTVANIVALIDGERVTPPVSSGLLAGTFRAELLARGEIRERVLQTHEIDKAPFWLINSVHEWRRAELVS